MAEKVTEYEKLLKDLATRVDETDAELIRSALDKVSLNNSAHGEEELTITRRQPLTPTMSQ